MLGSSFNYSVSNTYCVVFFSARLENPMLPVSLDCPFLIALSVFSKVYLLTKVASFILTRSDEKCTQYNLLFVVSDLRQVGGYL